MVVMLLIGLALTACSVVLLLRAAGARRARVLETIDEMGLYGFEGGGNTAVPTHGKSLSAAVDELAATLGALLARYSGHMKEDQIRGELQSAGMYGVSPRKFMGYRVLAGMLLPLLWLWLALSGGYSPLRIVFGVIVAGALGWQGPVILVRRRARFRLDEIDYQMPELIDVLVTTVEAGVGFSGSLQLAARRMAGPLGDELRLALQEQEMGLSTEEALTNLLERAETPAMRTFVRSVLQGETLGVSIGQIMRDLAVEMRKARRQKAEERAQKAPTKMLFPLIFLIFPAMFVVLLGPAVIEIFRGLKGI